MEATLIVFTRCGETLKVNPPVFNTCIMAYIATTQKLLAFILFCPNRLEIS